MIWKTGDPPLIFFDPPESKALETFWQEEPVIGWRAWKLDVEHIRLRSYVYELDVWRPRAAFRANCDRIPNLQNAYTPFHRPPDHRCICGIHSFRDLADLLPELHFGVGGLVIGRIAHWGRTIQCRKGWRSEFGYPLDLQVFEVPIRILLTLGSRETIAVALQKAYGVPARARRVGDGLYPASGSSGG